MHWITLDTHLFHWKCRGKRGAKCSAFSAKIHNTKQKRERIQIKFANDVNVHGKQFEHGLLHVCVLCTMCSMQYATLKRNLKFYSQINVNSDIKQIFNEVNRVSKRNPQCNGFFCKLMCLNSARSLMQDQKLNKNQTWLPFDYYYAFDKADTFSGIKLRERQITLNAKRNIRNRRFFLSIFIILTRNVL